MQTVIQSHKFQQILQKSRPLDCHVITVQVMAVADVSPTHQDTVGPTLKGPQYVVRRYGSRTHDPNGPDIGGVLQPANTG